MSIKENSEHLSNIQKADLTLASLLSSGGYLLPTQAAKFIRLMIKKSVIMDKMTVIGMKASKHEVNTMRFAGRVLKSGEPGESLPSGDRVKPDLGKVELDAQLFKCEVLINEEVFEDNIEGAELRNSIMQELGLAIARDIEYVALNGDTGSSDPLLKKLNGLIVQTTTHGADALGGTLSPTLLTKLKKALPHEYKQDPRSMVFWTSVNAEEDFGTTAADRNTALGDKYFDEWPGPRFRMTPVVGVPEMPENLGGGANQTVAIYTDPKNATLGIHKDIKLRVDEDIKAGNVIIVGKIRFDVKWANEDGTAKMIKVAAA